MQQKFEDIDWSLLSLNKNAIEILEKNKENIDWNALSCNKNAMELLEKNQDKINWRAFSRNPAIFKIDYEKMKNKNQDFEEELLREVMRPARLFKMIETYGEDYLEKVFE